MKRPAELTGLAGAAALLGGRLLGIDDADALVALGVVAGAAPAAVTAIVAAGGIRGLARALWRGRG